MKLEKSLSSLPMSSKITKHLLHSKVNEGDTAIVTKNQDTLECQNALELIKEAILIRWAEKFGK